MHLLQTKGYRVKLAPTIILLVAGLAACTVPSASQERNANAPGEGCAPEDGVCDAEAGETVETCAGDCPAPVVDPCGDGVCDAESGETVETCAGDCPEAPPPTTRPPSCSPGLDGHNTCGPALYEGGPGDQDCCESISLSVVSGEPIATARRLDKYLITAGRLRTFAEAVGGDVRSYVETLAAEDPRWDPAWNDLKLDPDGDNWIPSVPTNMDEFYYALGPWGAADCWSGGKGGGARTYYVPPETSRRLFGEGHSTPYSQADLDQKSINCVPLAIEQAFCIWDGGSLPTMAEFNVAWGTSTYPWGEDGTLIPTHANNMRNWLFPEEQNNDYTAHIAPPGRFPLGNALGGWSDLAGNMVESTFGDCVIPGHFCSTRSGSWDDHLVGVEGGWTAVSTDKYGAAGARCARPPI